MNDKNIENINRRFMGIERVVDKTSLSRSTIYRMERAGIFPQRRQLSPGRIAWVEQEIQDFCNSRATGMLPPVRREK